jgi:hypothetical protein
MKLIQVSTCMSASIRSTLSESTRCCPAPEPIDFKQECVELLANLWDWWLALESATFCCLFEFVIRYFLKPFSLSFCYRRIWNFQHQEHAVEAFRRAKFKFPGRQLIVPSRKWGFTSLDRPKYEEYRKSGRVVPDGVQCKLVKEHGPLSKWIDNPI